MSIDLAVGYQNTFDVPSEGLYVCRFLDNASVINLVNFVHKFDLAQLNQEEANDLHCTLVYSATSPTFDTRPLLDPCKAHVVRFEHWPGHDGDGYLVAVLQSESLQRIHKYWLSMGCTHSFPEYTPHITIKHPFSELSYSPQAAIRASRELERKPLALRLLRETLYEMKRDDQ